MYYSRCLSLETHVSEGALYLMMRNTTMRYDTNDVFFYGDPAGFFSWTMG